MNPNTCLLHSSNNNFLAASYLSEFLSSLKRISKRNPCNQEGSQYGRGGGFAVAVSLGVLPAVPACVQGEKVATRLMKGAVSWGRNS